MRYLFFLWALVLFFVSCSNVTFVHSQPEGMDSLIKIPEKLHGVYEFEDFELNTKSYVVTDSSIGGMVLGDNLIIKQRGNYLYLNHFVDNVYALYVVRITQFIDEDIEIKFLNITSENAHLFNILNLEDIKDLDEQNEGQSLSFKERPDYLIDDVSVNQLNFLLNSSKNIQRLLRVD